MRRRLQPFEKYFGDSRCVSTHTCKHANDLFAALIMAWCWPLQYCAALVSSICRPGAYQAHTVCFAHLDDSPKLRCQSVESTVQTLPYWSTLLRDDRCYARNQFPAAAVVSHDRLQDYCTKILRPNSQVHLVSQRLVPIYDRSADMQSRTYCLHVCSLTSACSAITFCDHKWCAAK